MYQTASGAQQHPLESSNADLIRSLQKSFAKTAAEHFPTSTVGIYPSSDDSNVAVLLVANKYSPQNFWNGRWRSTYTLSSSGGLSGSIKVDVHYYEDGNVRMSTSKAVEVANASGADAVVREIAKAENKFQEELNRAFVQLAEGSFKGLRRQLPVTRQRVEWEKIGGYRVSLASQMCGKDHILTLHLAWSGHRWRTLEVEPLLDELTWAHSWAPREMKVSTDDCHGMLARL